MTKPGIDPSLRHDAKQTNVIISEKKDKKAAAYNVTDLPWPYTSVVQYEQRFNMPLGSEWNARGVHQRETMPRVTKKVSTKEREAKQVCWCGADDERSPERSSSLYEECFDGIEGGDAELFGVFIELMHCHWYRSYAT